MATASSAVTAITSGMFLDMAIGTAIAVGMATAIAVAMAVALWTFPFLFVYS